MPLRLEVGPQDMKNNEAVIVRRDACQAGSGSKECMKANSDLPQAIEAVLMNMQKEMFARYYMEKEVHWLLL